MKFSVIIPCRNSAKTLSRVIWAIKTSALVPYEVIIVDDGSTDNSVDIARSHNVKVYPLNNNFGAGYCRNYGAMKASGDVFIFIDSDVAPSSKFIEIIQEEISSGAGAVGGEYFLSDDASHFTKLANSMEKYFWSKFHPRAEVGFVYGGLCAFKREAWFSSDRDFKENTMFPKMASGEDCYVCEQVNRQFKIIFRADLKGEHVTNLEERFFKRSVLHGFSRTRNILSNGFTGNSYTLFRGANLFYNILFYFFSIIFLFTGSLTFLFIGVLSGVLAFKFYFINLKRKDYFLMTKILMIQQIGWGLGVLKALLLPLRNWGGETFRFAQSTYCFLLGKDVSKIIFFVTNRCNFTCNWCLDKNRPLDNLGSNIAEELSIEKIERFCEKSRNKISYLILTGGEPFLRNDLDIIVNLFYQNLSTSFVTIVSNGSFPEKIEEQIERMLILCPYLKVNIQLTVSDIPAEHDQVRGLKGSYSLILDASERIKKLQRNYSRLIFTISTQVGKSNTKNLTSIIPDVKRLISPDEHIITPLRNVPQLITAADPTLELFSQYQDLLATLYSRGRNLFQIFYNQIIQDSFNEIKSIREDKAKYYECVAGKKFVTLYENGNVYACENRQDLKMGNIAESDYDLSKLLKTEKAKNAYTSQVSAKCQCDWGCAVSHNLMGDPVFIFQSFRTAFLIYVKSILRI